MLFVVSLVQIVKRRVIWSKDCPKNQDYYLETIYYKRLITQFIILLYLEWLNAYIDKIKNPWRGSGSEDGLLIATFLLFICLFISLILNLLRNKFFEMTMETMSKEIKNGKIKEVIDNLSLEGRSYRIWGQGYAVAYKEVIEILERLNEIKCKEELAIKGRTEFITNSSHDIKTPLTSIINYIDILKNKEITEEERVKFTRDLKKRISILNDLICDLDYSNELSNENVKVSYENINIEELLEEVIKSLEEQLSKRGLSIKRNISIKNINIKLDKKATLRVFQNIIENILKYGKEHSEVSIDIYDVTKKNKGEKYIAIKITNISKEEIKLSGTELMKRFKRGEEARTIDGSGLGLDISKSLMKLQNGELTIDINNDLFSANLLFVRDEVVF